MTMFYGTRTDVDPASGFLVGLHVLMWTTFTLGLIALLVVIMLT